MERKVFTQLRAPDIQGMNERLNLSGFRRSQGIAYRPACEGCRACVSLRVLTGPFEETRSMRRIVRRNRDLVIAQVRPKATDEQYDLFRRYLEGRHENGGMDDMRFNDYLDMIEGGSGDSHLVEYRRAGADEVGESALLAVCFIDRMSDGMSLLYSYYAPDETPRSLGNYVIIDQIRRARRLGLPYVYLGYWVQGSPKMDYKVRFQPAEGFVGNKWVALSAETADTALDAEDSSPVALASETMALARALPG